jgi:hypothetical protein
VSEQLIDLLKFGLLALLYLFFLRVIWAVWTELRAPATETVGAPARARAVAPPSGGRRRTRPGRKQATQLRIIEPADLAGGVYPLAAEMTMGRAPGCSIVVDDTYVSQLHARVFLKEGVPHVEDLGSTNGTYRNGDPVSGPLELALGDRVQVGNLVVEVA